MGRSDIIIVNDTKRVFIAINLNKEIKKYLSNIQEDIINYNSSQLKMKTVERRNLHISIKFLGDLNRLEIEKISRALQKLSSKYKPFRINLSKRVGIFPNTKKPRVIWIGVEKGNSEVEKIYHDIERELQSELFYHNDKKFTTHITLGRVKYIKYPNNLIEFMKKIDFKDISQMVNSVELMESNLTTKGPIYGVISEFLFLQ